MEMFIRGVYKGKKTVFTVLTSLLRPGLWRRQSVSDSVPLCFSLLKFFYCTGSVFKITVIANQMFSGWYFMVDLNLMVLFCVYNFIILRRLKRPKL